MSEIFRVFHGFTKAKVSEFNDSIVKENVAGLDVSVHNVVFDEHFESGEELIKVWQGFFFRELALGFYFLLESALIAKLIHKVIIVGSFENFNEADDVSGVFDFRESVDFVDGELFEFGRGPELLNLNNFDSNNLACLLVVGFVDFTEFPCSYCRLQNVVLYFLAHRPQSVNIINIR